MIMDDDGLPPLRPTSFTVSHTFDTHRNGTRHNHYCLMVFELPPGTSEDMALAMSIKGSVPVTKAAILHAMARGQITQDEAKDRLKDMEDNHALLIKSARRAVLGEVGDSDESEG